MQTQTTISIPDLRAAVRGHVITSDDSAYDPARTVFLGDIDRRPAAIIRVSDAADVQRVVAYAGDTGVELAIRCGGHSSAGHGTTDGGIVIDLRDMKGIEINPGERTAWAQGGLTALEVSVAAAAHGLAVGFGDTGSVGIGGITTGGGIGYLVRKHGLTIDALLAAEVVTADSQFLEVDANAHPDLFWAIRGGGGNFGVVTRFKYQPHPLDSIVGGMLFLPATAETVAGFIAAAEAAPQELSTIANVMPAPPMPFLAEEHHGQVIILGIVCYAGDPGAGERALAPFRALATPLADLVKPMPYPEIYPPEDESYRPKVISRTLFMDHIGHDEAQLILNTLAASDASMRVAQLRVLGGAAARVPNDATAYAHRGSRIMVNVASFYEGPEDHDLREQWVTDFAARLNQGDHGAYVNFLADEGSDRVRDAYPGTTWDRLIQIKARYDPTNLFRLNQNIPPANGG